jgi:N-acetylneuraminic acid mutarotase
MTRNSPLTMAFTSGVLALAACDENTAPNQSEKDRDLSPTIPWSLAVVRNSWTEKARLPALAGEDGPARYGLAAGVVNNAAGHPILYVFGGHDGDIFSGRDAVFQWDNILAYDLVTDTWTEKTTHLKATYSNGIGKIGNLLYISGGYDASIETVNGENQLLSSLYAYNSGTDRLTRKADMPKHTSEGISGVINGKLYVLAGRCAQLPGDCLVGTSRLLFRYNPLTNTWGTKRLAPHFHRQGAGGVINGKFYVVGGTDIKGNDFTTTLDAYDPVTNTWKTLAPMPEARSRMAAAVLGGKLYVIGGSGPSGMIRRTVFVYDPVTNSWRTRTSMPTGRFFLAAAPATLGGQSYILAVGGFDGSSSAGRNELYTP